LPVDVLTELVIDRPVADVAAFAADPDNAPVWYENIESVEWQSPRPLSVGSRVAELEPGQKLVMRTSEGPFPMETTYTWEALGQTTTRMTLRNRGAPSGFSKLISPLMVCR